MIYPYHKKAMLIVLAISSLTFSCNYEEPVIIEEEFGIVQASSRATSLFTAEYNVLKSTRDKATLESENSQSFDLDQFKNSEVVKVYNSRSHNYLFTSLSAQNNELSLTMAIDEISGEVHDVFITQSINKGDRAISHIFTVEGLRLLSFDLFEDGTRNVFYVSSQEVSGIFIERSGWWSRFDKCAGQLNAPTDSNVANIFFGTIANAATLGLYTPLSLLVCAGVASGSND